MNEEFTKIPNNKDNSPHVEVIEVKETNIYSFFRTFFLALAFLICLFLVLFLIYLNGKGVYESGI